MQNTSIQIEELLKKFKNDPESTYQIISEIGKFYFHKIIIQFLNLTHIHDSKIKI